MSNHPIANQLANLFKARFPFLYLPSWEEDRVVKLIEEVARNQALIKTPRKVFVWTATMGATCDGLQEKEDLRAPLRMLEFIALYDQPAVFVLKDFHVNFGALGKQPDPLVIRRLRDLVPLLKRSARPKNVVFVSPSIVLPLDLQKDITVVDFPLPGLAEIQGLLGELITANKASGRITIDLDAAEESWLAKAALGLTLAEAENAFALAMVNDGRLDGGDVPVVLEEKRQVIKKSEVLEYVKTELSLDDVGGLENLKRWLRKRDKAWDEEAKRYNLPAPKGVLITGVPGCGKSMTAKAISAAWRLPLLRLDMGKIFSGLVGSSEENMRRAIQTAEAIAPCILWIDEIEKGLGGVAGPNAGSGDSGTSTRVFGTFLTWMQEKTASVFVVATANNIAGLPPELMRKGRFDEIFFVDLPTRRERAEIFKLHMQRRLTDAGVAGEVKLEDDTYQKLAVNTEGFVGAEIEQAVIAALFEAYSEDRALVWDDFVKAVRRTVPLSITQAEAIRALRDWANMRAVAATPMEDRIEYEQKPEQPQDDVRASRGGRTIDF